jgi:hypothetical protein
MQRNASCIEGVMSDLIPYTVMESDVTIELPVPTKESAPLVVAAVEKTAHMIPTKLTKMKNLTESTPAQAAG